jgi:hypothetical protein
MFSNEYSNNQWHRLDSILELVAKERLRQEKLKQEGKFPWTCGDVFNPDSWKPVLNVEKLTVLAEEFGEVASIVCKLQANRAEAKEVSLDKLREELIQVAAVAVAWAESL